MNWRLVRIVLANLLLLSGAGCKLPHRAHVPPMEAEALDDVSFLHYLASAPTVTVSQGVRAVLMLRGATEQWPTFEEQHKELLRLGAVKAIWKLAPGQTLDKGTFAHMLRVLCDLPAGASEILASVTRLGDRRYALRTCIAEKLLPYGQAHEPVRGGELVAALARAEEFVTAPLAENSPP